LLEADARTSERKRKSERDRVITDDEMTIKIRVPASTSNLGPGFDVLGLALTLHNELIVEGSDRFSLQVQGEGRGVFPEDESNLIWLAARRACEEVGYELPKLQLRCVNAIPADRGLGSSSAAIVTGLLLGDYYSGSTLGRDRLLELATELEGHPDNVAPALFGGLQVAVRDGNRVHRVEVNAAMIPHVVVFIPPFKMRTNEARAVLPSTVPLESAVYNIGRAALLVAALSAGRFEVLDQATRDAIHQSPRTRIFSAMPALLDAARAAGALGAWLSGAGSTIAAFARTVEQAHQISKAMMDEGVKHSLHGVAKILAVDTLGATIERL
jgi:homoserine kinase